MSDRTETRPPWKRKNPKEKSKGLTGAQKHEARDRARKAGRQYPNLVDNMAVARKKRSSVEKTAASKTGRKKAVKKKAVKKKTARKSAR